MWILYGRELGASYKLLGNLLSSAMCVSGVLCLVLPNLSDKYGIDNALAVAITTNMIGGLIEAAAPNVLFLAIANFLGK